TRIARDERLHRGIVERSHVDLLLGRTRARVSRAQEVTAVREEEGPGVDVFLLRIALDLDGSLAAGRRAPPDRIAGVSVEEDDPQVPSAPPLASQMSCVGPPDAEIFRS